ncbi:MAG: four helix bundle protein [Bacteroidetes bacterium]|nr:four helix bundle protein [Bacteroidota bacterium]
MKLIRNWTAGISLSNLFMQTLDTLEVYIAAKSFRKAVIKTAKTFPNEEKFLLTAQRKDSARSVAANIAEGYRRYYDQGAIKFCRNAPGSLMETYDPLSSALEDEYITEERFLELKNQYEQVLKLINGYIAYLKRRKQED